MKAISVARVVQLYRGGLSMQDIATMLNCGIWTVKLVLQKANVRSRHTGTRSAGYWIKQLENFEEVATKLNLNLRDVEAALIELNICRARPASERKHNSVVRPMKRRA